MTEKDFIDIFSYAQLRDACYNSVKEKHKSIIWPKKAGRDKLLYHYTNTTGFTGIIKSKKLWLTDSKFLNDKGEVLYGRIKVHYWLENIHYEIKNISEEKRKIFDTIREKLIKYFGNKIENTQFDGKDSASEDDEIYFISCFCDDNDSLNQWQGYTDKNGGYAIGFQAEQLAKFTKRNAPLNKYRRCFTNVIYEPKDSNISNPELSLLKPLVYEMIDWLYHQILESTDDENVKKEDLLFHAVLSNLNLLSIVTKNAKFKVEKEWRICYGGVPFKNFNLLDYIDFRSTRFGLSPYLELPLNTDYLFIQEIVVGPSNWMSAQKNALRNFLIKHKLSNIKISESEIPLKM